MRRAAAWLVCWLAAGAALPVDQTPSVAVGERIEFRVPPAALGVPAALDPYDPDQVRVDARVSGPDGAEVVQPAFWLVPQERWEQTAFSTERKADVPWERFRAAGDGAWCLRFAPPRPGAYRWRWQVALRGGAAATVDGGSFTATGSLRPGAGQGALAASGRTLATADGQPFIPVGINCAWPTEAGSAVYRQWLDHLAAAGGNATRLWLVHYYGGTALEWSRSGVNDGYVGVGGYSQESAARVDRILADCEARGIRVMLCLNTFGDLNWDWERNPYATGGGGWLERSGQYFTDPRARLATRKLLRYEIARWGGSRALWAWELWNEVDTCDEFDAATVTAWHREMAAEIARLDAHRHPITTDYRFTPPTTDCGAYALPELAFTQLHTYWPFVPEAFVSEIAHLADFRRADGTAKPVVIGEYGLHVEPQSLAADRVGIHLHDGLWGGVFCGSCGGGMGWWWDGYVEPKGLWAHCRGLAAFVRGESLEGLAPAGASTDAGDAAPALALAGTDRAWAWVRNAREVVMQRRGLAVQIGTYRAASHGTATTVRIVAQLPGAWRVDAFDPYDGTWVASLDAHGTADGITVALPPYRHDLALKLRRLTAPEPLPQGPPAPTPWHDEVELRMQP
jgi:hypothetical protein